MDGASGERVGWVLSAAGRGDGEDGGGCWAFWQMLCWGSGIPGLSKASVLLGPTEPSAAPQGPPQGPPGSPPALARTLPT